MIQRLPRVPYKARLPVTIRGDISPVYHGAHLRSPMDPQEPFSASNLAPANCYGTSATHLAPEGTGIRERTSGPTAAPYTAATMPPHKVLP